MNERVCVGESEWFVEIGAPTMFHLQKKYHTNMYIHNNEINCYIKKITL